MPDIWMDVDTALAEVPVNIMPLIDDTDFKTIEGAVAYNAAGMALRWHFVTTGGAYTVTSVTPTTAGTYDWTDQGDSGIYTIEIPASGGASINNDTEGFGWFTGVATGVLPWRGPVIGFRAAALNNLLIDDAYSTTRGLAGTALPNAAADAAGGLPVSDVGGLDLDARLDAAVSSRLAPTTAGRTLDVSATGEAGIDWANVGSPTTTLALTNTTIATTQKVDLETIKTNPVVNAGTVTFPTTATLASTTNITAGTITTTTNLTNLPTIPTNWITADGIAADAIGASELATGAVNKIADQVWDEDATTHSTLSSTGKYLTVGSDSAGNVATQIGTAGAGLTAIGDTRIANLDATVSSRSTLTQTQVSGGAYALNSASFGFNAAVNNAIADQVWDEVLSGHLTAGTTGNALNAAGAAGDPWSTSLPGAYGAGSAGKIIGDNINATISSRASQTSVDDVPTVAEFEARTIVSSNYGTAANQSAIIGYIDTEVAATLAAVDTEVAAIKAKTDQLTFTIANQVDSNALSGGGSGLDAAGVRAAVGLASANLDTQLSDLPTNAELATALGTADDAVLAAIAALNNLSAAQVNTEVDAALSDVGVTLARMGALTDWIDGGRLDLLLDAILDDTGTAGVVVAAGSKAGYALAATGVDLVLVDGKTLPAALQIIAASAAGIIVNAGTANESFKGLDKSTTRLSLTVDANGNRTDATYS